MIDFAAGAPTSAETIHEVEELAYNSWPAAVVQQVDGWHLRFNQGVTSRANSVWPEAAGLRLTVAEKLAVVEEFYLRRRHPPRFQVSPVSQPAGLDALLDARGYDPPRRLTSVEVADIEAVVAGTSAGSDFQPFVSEALTDEWFITYCLTEHANAKQASERQAILRRIGPPAVFVRLEREGDSVAVGMGVLERGWLGVYCVATRIEFRRQGAGNAVLHSLARWGTAHGARRVYLQVMRDNQAARQLYARIGFQPLYEYYYREKPITGPQPDEGSDP